MEHVHRTEQRDWISQVINVRKFRDDITDTVRNFKGFTSDEDYTALYQELLQEGEDPDELMRICGPDAFTCDHDDEIELVKSFEIPDNVDLMTVRLQKEDVNRRNADPKYRTFLYNNKVRCYTFPPSEPLGKKCGAVSEMPSNPIELPDVLLAVQIFRPERALYKSQKHAPPRIPTFTVDQELLIYGSQYLTELRDKIECVSDLCVRGEFSNNPSEAVGACLKDIYKSGFFYINGVFYNDTRYPENKDYSQVIMKWAADTDRGIGPFSKAAMESTQFIDLTLQLGYPYVYRHQGHCEHLMVFTDLRMMDKEDSLGRDDYPMLISVTPKRRVVCMVCHTHTAKWMVTKNERLPETPYFFCDMCFKMFNYTADGKKIGSFEARKFFDRSLLL